MGGWCRVTGPRIGELCAGYGGLAMAVTSVLGGELAWVADNDPGAAKILAYRFPGVPNLGDITAADWTTVPAVDLMCMGFPCTDVSCAGARAGLRAGTRSGVWTYCAQAIGALRPAMVVIENVRGLLSAGADSPVEWCPGCMGEVDQDHLLRALGAVLGDLADIGFDADWVVVSASDAGAPHRRERVFVTAWPAADPDRAAGSERRLPAPGQAPGRRPRTDAGRPGGAPAADAERDGCERRPPGADDGADAPGERPWAAAAGRSSGAAADTAGGGQPTGQRAADGWSPAVGVQAVGWAGDGRETAANPGSEGRGRPDKRDTGRAAHRLASHGRDADGCAPDAADSRWGEYAAAIARWESVTSCPAPAPTEPGRTGERLSPAFVEWMMGLPRGHVTGVPGLSRADQLRALGNGVVPQQAVLALRILLDRVPAQLEAS